MKFVSGRRYKGRINCEHCGGTFHRRLQPALLGAWGWWSGLRQALEKESRPAEPHGGRPTMSHWQGQECRNFKLPGFGVPLHFQMPTVS